MTFHSEDSKVPIGLTAANKQAPMVTHMVTLPDHEFVVAPKHKIIPSNIGDMRVVKSRDLTNDAISYSGATYILEVIHMYQMCQALRVIYIRSSARYDEDTLYT